MQLIETLSVNEVGAALGLRSASVRLRIQAGQLAAVKVGRGWRVHVESVNALLKCVHQPKPAASQASLDTFPPEAQPTHLPIEPPVAKPSGQPRPIFDDSDMRWIQRFRSQLLDADPAVVANASWQLGQFARRAQMDPTLGVPLP